jgi:uncharacterized membrane protein
MNDDQIKIAREKVDKIFSDMQSGIKIETEENIKENTDETQKGISLAQVIECAGVSITTDLMSPKYKLVMKNMGDNDRAIMTALKGVIPLFLIKLSTEFHVPSDKIKELGMNLTELANVYTYALIKMTATEDISNITSPDKSAEGLEFFSELTLENKCCIFLLAIMDVYLDLHT